MMSRHTKIIATLGRSFLNPDQTIHRGKLGEMVFKDPEKLQQLNGISHPYIVAMIQEQAEALALRRKDGIVFLEAALLIEADWKSHCEQVWVVVASPALVQERLRQSRGLTREQIQARLAAQITNEARVTHASVVLENNASTEILYRQLDQGLARLERP